MSKVRLGDVAEVITKGTTPTSIGYGFQDYGINFIKIESIAENGNFLKDKFAHISVECNESLKRSQLRRNDLLFSIAGAIGRVAIVDDSILPANTNQALAIIRITEGIINYNYLNYFLKSEAVIKQYSRKKQGVAQINLSLKDISDLIISVPSISQQNKIVKTLSFLDELIKNTNQQKEKMDELIKSRFVEMFGDPITNEYKWARVNLGSVCRIQSSKRVFEKDYVTNGIPFLRTKEIVELSNGKPISTELFISTEHFNSLKSKYGVPQKNDLLVSAVGTIGTIWIVDGSFDFYYKDGNIIQIKPSERFNSLFMKHLLEKLINNYKNKMSTGTAYSALTIVGIKKMEAYDVPIELQNKFADFVTKVDQQKATVQKSIDKLETLKKSLMQEYFG